MKGRSVNSIVKVPEGLLKKANSEGILHLVQFWYLLKSKENSGHFKELKDIHKHSKETLSSTYKKVNKLIKLNWIKKDSVGYKLVSYDTLFGLLGYNMVLKECKKGFRRGKFKIFKIKISDFKQSIYLQEIKLNFQRQKYQIAKKLLTQKRAKVDATKRVNKEVTLSVRGISRIFGLKSSSAGHKIEKFLEEINLISIIKRPVLSDWSLPNLIILS